MGEMCIVQQGIRTEHKAFDISPDANAFMHPIKSEPYVEGKLKYCDTNTHRIYEKIR